MDIDKESLKKDIEEDMKILGLKPYFNKIAAIDLLKKRTGLGILDRMDLYDELWPESKTHYKPPTSPLA